MAPDPEHPSLVRLRDWCAARGIVHKGAIKREGARWRADLSFSDIAPRFMAQADSANAAMAQVISQSIGWREDEERRAANGIATVGTLSGRERPAYESIEVTRVAPSWRKG